MKDFLIGNFTDVKNGTGATVILSLDGAVGGIDVKGSAPGTRETDLLKGCKAVDKINAVTLCGGSAFGLEACDGVMQYLYSNNVGFSAGNIKVPIVCGAVLFDLDYKNFSFPNKLAGLKACENASAIVETGSVGAGTGATVGKILGLDNCSKGGLGYFETNANELFIGCVVAVNAMGDVYDINDNCKIVAGAKLNGEFINTSKYILNNSVSNNSIGKNTTIGCVITNAKLTREQANKLAEIAQNGLVLSISPIHTMFDGDTMFVMSSNKVDVDFNVLMGLTAETVRKSVLNAVGL